MNIIGIAGGIGSGKSTVGEFAKEKHWKIIETSSLLSELLLQEGNMCPTREDKIAKAHFLAEKYGKNFLATLALEKIKESIHKKIMIIGLRHPEQIQHIRLQYVESIFGYMDTSLRNRLERTIAREGIENDDDAKHKILALMLEENGSHGNTSMHLPLTKDKCDFLIPNNNTKDKLKEYLSLLL